MNEKKEKKVIRNLMKLGILHKIDQKLILNNLFK